MRAGCDQGNSCCGGGKDVGLKGHVTCQRYLPVAVWSAMVGIVAIMVIDVQVVVVERVKQQA